MNRTWKPCTLIAFAFVALSCTEPAAVEPPAEPEPESVATVEPTASAEPMDATVVDPDHYKVEFENDGVRIVRITYGPGEESVMHYHPDHVAVFLTDLHSEFLSPDGTSEEVQAEAGTILFLPAGQHHPRSISDQPFEAIAVELKPGSAGAGETADMGETGPDPVGVDAGHYEAEFENDRVRVLRINYGPGEESVMHYHPEHVAVFLTDQHWQLGSPDGESQEIRGKAGEHILAPAGQHLPKNIGAEPAEVIVVELK